MEHEMRTTSVMVLPKGKPLFCLEATTVTITDEAAGEFVTVSQCADTENTVKIAPEDWPIIRRAINQMILQCR